MFTGSGSTAAVDRLIACLNLRLPADLDHRYHLGDRITDRPVVFIGPYEHHSNELPWRESIADVVTIPEDADGHIDVAALRQALERHAGRRLIGSFSAASNVTGILTDCDTISELLHEHGGVAFWDFAAAGPYVTIHAEAPAGRPLAYKDAIFLSPHKFIGGPGTPGLLLARRELFTNSVPAVVGGGTVSYVNPDEHQYLADIEHREEAGTPAIVEAIRAGLVFGLKEAVGARTIETLEADLVRRAIAAWQEEPGIEILGNTDAERLSIVSFVVRRPEGRYLHHNFLVAVLNDLFGIQSRGGCSCAGPYGHRLLGIDLATSHEFEREITLGCEGIKPGWTRVNFNYFLTDEVFRYIVSAVILTARWGHRLLPQYDFEAHTGLWRHHSAPPEPPLSLARMDFTTTPPHLPGTLQTAPAAALADYLAHARDLLAALPEPRLTTTSGLSEDFEALRWFDLAE
ncbi:MAG: aminotransferase class V-fold PLP-dependent enzyme [Candidatus Nanopelagicales bacterium]